jgi:alpha-L-fucosidase
MRDGESGEHLTWEVCHTFSGSWGYNRDEATWKSPKMLIDTLVKTVACGGNLIMNVGPTSRGRFDKRATRALEAYAEWMSSNSRAIYGCTMADPDLTPPRGTALTQSEDGRRLYVHFLEYPFGSFDMPELVGRVKYAQFLSDGSEVLFSEKMHKNHDTYELFPTLEFALPTIPPEEITPVIEIILK